MTPQATGGGSPLPPDQGSISPLEQRLINAWRASGMGLGKLVVAATNRYALGAAVSMTGLVDEALVSMCERYVKDEQATGGLDPDPPDPG